MDKKVTPLIPEKELKCIWMTAGLLSYKLCKYDMQCEKCPLDRELGNLSEAPLAPKNLGAEEAAPCSSMEKGNLGDEIFNENLSLFYHPGHTWVKVERANVVRIGIDSFLGTLLKKVKVVILPLCGRRGLLEEHLCSIIQDEGILHIVFPVSGLILSTNERLKDQPELITRDPLGEGFLLTLKPKNLQRDQKYLFSGEDAFAWYRGEREHFKEAVLSELSQGREKLGVTMQDGGVVLTELKEVIPPKRYIQLVSTFLSKREKSPPHVLKKPGSRKMAE